MIFLGYIYFIVKLFFRNKLTIDSDIEEKRTKIFYLQHYWKRDTLMPCHMYTSVDSHEYNIA